MSEEPELFMIEPPAGAGTAYRDRLARHRAEARRRYVAHLAPVLATDEAPADSEERAGAVIDALTVWTSATSGEPCSCSCHPQLPTSDLHDLGFACPCRQRAEERRRHWDEWHAELDAYWASPEGRAATAARQADEDALAAWVADQPGVVVSSHGGMAPEQWRGEVDGHSFYFRERHDDWRIELDLRGSGRFVKTWVGGDLDGEGSFEPREIDEGDVIADGTIAAEGYGTSPVERARFIVDVIRTHLERRACDVHASERADLERRLGRELAWCPACGIRLRPTLA